MILDPIEVSVMTDEVPVDSSISHPCYCTDSDLMKEIGRFRYKVWQQERSINDSLFPDSCWIDSEDNTARHWILRDIRGDIIASARITFHPHLDESSRDIQLWRKCGKNIPLPTVDLGRLVVSNEWRGRGIAQTMNHIRINAARDMGAKSIIVTASDGNARLLRKIGFVDIGETIEFSDRPGTIFHAMQYDTSITDNDAIATYPSLS